MNYTTPYARMDPRQVAEYVGLLGPAVTWSGGLPWMRVRPGFYRPVQILQPLPERRPQLPLLARCGGAQWAVSDPREANSHLNLVVFTQAERYSPASLDKKRRWQLRQAQLHLRVREFSGPEEFSACAHPVYLSFQDRSGYQVGRARRDPLVFAEWGRRALALAGIRVLGAWHESQLTAVSVTYRVEDTVQYATFFCDDTGLKYYSADLMLHVAREMASVSPGVKRVSAGTWKKIPGLDDFYRLRGAEIAAVPARLHLNPFVRASLQCLKPGQLRRLQGEVAPLWAMTPAS